MEESVVGQAQAAVPSPFGDEAAPAGFWVRAGAAFIDGLALVVALVAASFVVVLAIKDRATSVKVIQAASVLIGGVYYSVLTGFSGQTLGKMAAGIRVETKDGGRPTYLRSMGRWAAYSLSSLPLGLGFAFAGWNKGRRGLHDYVAGTRVVFLPGVGKGRKAGMMALGGLFVAATVAYAVLAAVGEMEGGPAAMQDRLQKEGASIGSLKDIRTVIAMYKGEKGAAPAKLEDLKALKDFTALPQLTLPDHAASDAVEVYQGVVVNGAVDATKLKDTGHWAYDPATGTVFIDCTHVDTEGNGWYKY